MNQFALFGKKTIFCGIFQNHTNSTSCLVSLTIFLLVCLYSDKNVQFLIKITLCSFQKTKSDNKTTEFFGIWKILTITKPNI